MSKRSSNLDRESPPWFDVTTDAYHWCTFPGLEAQPARAAQGVRIQELLKGQHANVYRLRLILREQIDLRSGSQRDPFCLWDYDFGCTTILRVAEIVAETRSGQRQPIQYARRGLRLHTA